MQRKPAFPISNCSIKIPDSMAALDSAPFEEEGDHVERRQQLINFGHTLWGFNNWSWSVTKQELDFVDFTGGKFSAGVVSFVSVSVKTLDIHRENIGYATSLANSKGSAIYQSRKCAVTNALRETLFSFGGSVASDLTELLETTQHKTHLGNQSAAAEQPENNQNLINKPIEPKNSTLNKIKDSADSSCSVRAPHPGPPMVKNATLQPVPAPVPPPAPPAPPPVAIAHPMAATLPPAANRPPLPANAPRPPHVRPNSNEVHAQLPEGGSEEARAERRRRQRLAQEEFRLKQQLKQKAGQDEKQDDHRNSSGFDKLLMDIPSQDILIEETDGETDEAEAGKRKSPAPEGSAKRRGGVMSCLDIASD